MLTSDKAVEDFRASHKLRETQGATVNDQQITDLNTKLIDARAEPPKRTRSTTKSRKSRGDKGDPGSVAEALASDTIARLRSQYADLVNE